MQSIQSTFADPTKSRAAGEISPNSGSTGTSRVKLKENPSRSIATVAEETTSRPSESSTPPAVIEYRDFPERPINLIAAKYGVAPATLIYRARKAHVCGRRRGRHRLQEPNPRQRRIINMYNHDLSGCKIARKMGVSPQCIYRLLNRWKHLLSARPRIAEVSSASPAVARRREVRDKVVSFRLTGREAGQAKEVLGTLGFSKRVSSRSFFKRAWR
jgi:transposase-like protein